jgi:DNA-binding NarL/FixJ family response regulator
VVSELRQHPEIEVIQAMRDRSGAVAVLVAGALDEYTMLHLRRFRRTDGLRVVLVASVFPEAGLLKAIEYGVEVVLWRHEVTGQRLLEAVLAASRGDVRLPPDLGERLRVQVGRLRPGVLDESGVPAAGLAPREIDVIRLLAEGLDTGTIAAELSYSERTIKKILFDVKTRLNLRNRAHVVAYAFRHGWL